MRILIIALGLIILLGLIGLMAFALYAYIWHEDYEPFITQQKKVTDEEDPADKLQRDKAYIQKQYTAYRTMYNAFLPLWEQALTTARGEQTPPTRDQLNAQAMIISKGQPIPFPPMTDPLPETMSPTFQPVSRFALRKAMEWMSTNMAQAHAALQQSLKGGEPFQGMGEGFTNPTSEDVCQQIIQCQTDQEQKKTSELLEYFRLFEGDTQLQTAWKHTQYLAAESKRIQEQAESGELLSQFEAPESTVAFEKPAGAKKGAEWAAYKKRHPKEAAESEHTLGPWAAVADWAHNMNGRF